MYNPKINKEMHIYTEEDFRIANVVGREEVKRTYRMSLGSCRELLDVVNMTFDMFDAEPTAEEDSELAETYQYLYMTTERFIAYQYGDEELQLFRKEIGKYKKDIA